MGIGFGCGLFAVYDGQDLPVYNLLIIIER
jgi:hypothetical protein